MTVSHASLTGADLHESKGAATAASGTIQVADGLGSATWVSPTTLTSEVGKLQPFATPLVPTGWLECDGSAPSRSTYLDLFNAVTIQQTGSKNNGVAQITGLSDTSKMKVGYFIGGANITNGTTILSIDSSTQVTMSAAATGTSSNTVYVSPWALGNGTTTFTLPDFTTTGRFPRSRTSANQLGKFQSNQNLTHHHACTTDNTGAHTHAGSISGGTGNASGDHTHTYNGIVATVGTVFALTSGAGFTAASGATSGGQSATHNHSLVTTSDGNHTHNFDTGDSGGTETRPESISVMWCIKY